MSQKIAKAERTYSLHALTLEEDSELTISKEEFSSLQQAKVCLDSAFSLEENYDLLLENYRELEVEALSAAVSSMTTTPNEYNDFFEIRTAINRRMVNLLTATRIYLDQYPQSLKKVGANRKAAKEVCSAAYDEFFEYRFMEELRNHAQHVGLAVQEVKMNVRWVPHGELKDLRHSVKPYAKKEELMGMGFKKAVLNECPERVDLISAARTHVGGISSVHKKVRELAAPFIEDARRLFEDVISRHCTSANKRYLSLAAIAKEEGVVVDEIPIFLEWDDVRQKLQNKNFAVEHLAKGFVTNQTEESGNS